MPNKEKIKHIGIIINGNRSWARERNLPVIDGYAKSFWRIKAVPEWFFNAGVNTISFFVFPLSYWQRPQEEVNYILKLIEKTFKDDLEEFNKKSQKIVFSGEINKLPGGLEEICQNASLKTRANTSGTLNICLNYGGREEIIEALKKMMNLGLEVEQLHAGMLRKYLYQPNISDPELVIHTGGKYSRSNFMIWQTANSELYFMEKYWPDFEKSDVDKIIKKYIPYEQKKDN